MSAEIKSIKLNIENQGFVFSDINYLYDETANDDDLANMPYSQLTELCEEAGFLYVGSHGNINTLLIGRTMHPAAIEFWCNYDEDVYIAATDEEDYPSEWNHDNPLFSAIVNSDWINKYWKVDLENNNTVTILSACKAHSGIGESCAGGICFAYDEDTYLNTCIQNNENLLKKMNGKRNNSQYRSAIDAYDNMILLSGFTYEANASITLCPATKDFYPSNNELVPSTVTEGYFEIDTWCDATIPASQALTFQTINGDINVNPIDVSWVIDSNDSQVKSNKIVYEWTGSGTLRVIVNTSKIIAYGGGGQKLDFDRKTPNGELASYTFSVYDESTESFICDFSAAPSTMVHISNSVTFSPHCTDNILSHEWVFEGGNPVASTSETPIVTYDIPGLYSVIYTARGLDNQVETVEKQNYILVYDPENMENNYSISCDYSIVGERGINYFVYIDDVPEGVIFEIKLHYGDGTESSTITVDYPTILDFTRWYSNYGTYHPFIEVKKAGHDDVLFIENCGPIDIFNFNPCSNFTADFTYTPEDPAPYEDISFEPQINNCNGQCYWSWEFTDQPSQTYDYDEPIWCNSSTNLNVSKNYSAEGNYYVKLTVYETEIGCMPIVIEKEIPIRHRHTCYDPIYIGGF